MRIVTTSDDEYTVLRQEHSKAAALVGVIVQLTDSEIATLIDLSRSIRINKTADSTDNTWDGVGYEERNLKGLKGAFALAKYLGGHFDDAIHNGQDAGWDVRVGAKHIEVKTLQAWLTVTRSNALKAPFVALSNLISHNVVRLVGWTTREAFLRDHFLADFGYGPRLCMTAAKLNPVTDLLEKPSRPIQVVLPLDVSEIRWSW